MYLIKQYLHKIFAPSPREFRNLNKRNAWHGSSSWISLNKRNRRGKFKKRSRQYGA